MNERGLGPEPLAAIQEGLDELASGRTRSHDEVRDRMLKDAEG